MADWFSALVSQVLPLPEEEPRRLQETKRSPAKDLTPRPTEVRTSADPDLVKEKLAPADTRAGSSVEGNAAENGHVKEEGDANTADFEKASGISKDSTSSDEAKDTRSQEDPATVEAGSSKPSVEADKSLVSSDTAGSIVQESSQEEQAALSEVGSDQAGGTEKAGGSWQTAAAAEVSDADASGGSSEAGKAGETAATGSAQKDAAVGSAHEPRAAPEQHALQAEGAAGGSAESAVVGDGLGNLKAAKEGGGGEGGGEGGGTGEGSSGGGQEAGSKAAKAGAGESAGEVLTELAVGEDFTPPVAAAAAASVDSGSDSNESKRAEVEGKSGEKAAAAAADFVSEAQSEATRGGVEEKSLNSELASKGDSAATDEAASSAVAAAGSREEQASKVEAVSEARGAADTQQQAAANEAEQVTGEATVRSSVATSTADGSNIPAAAAATAAPAAAAAPAGGAPAAPEAAPGAASAPAPAPAPVAATSASERQPLPLPAALPSNAEAEARVGKTEKVAGPAASLPSPAAVMAQAVNAFMNAVNPKAEVKPVEKQGVKALPTDLSRAESGEGSGKGGKAAVEDAAAAAAVAGQLKAAARVEGQAADHNGEKVGAKVEEVVGSGGKEAAPTAVAATAAGGVAGASQGSSKEQEREEKEVEKDESRLSLSEMIGTTQQGVYQPAEFFVAWQGVLTIVYLGIPPALEKLKGRVERRFPSLPAENPGSKWPKTSLACLKNDQRLSREQLSILRDICSKVSFQLAFSPPVVVDKLSVVFYENCCLEKQIMATHVALRGPVDESNPTREQQLSVREVVDEFAGKNLQKYWFHVSKDGNRSNHYRQPQHGTTLVHFLGDQIPPALAIFKRLVEAALPEMYDWFPLDTLHITLRALS